MLNFTEIDRPRCFYRIRCMTCRWLIFTCTFIIITDTCRLTLTYYFVNTFVLCRCIITVTTKLTIEEMEEREKNVSEINAWHVAKELAVRADDEPGPGGDQRIVNVAEKLGKLTKLGPKCLLTRKL